MNALFIGMILVFLDVRVGFGDVTLDVLPDFLGCWLMMRGLSVLAKDSPHFAKARFLSMGLMVYAAVVYVAELQAVTVQSQFTSFCLGLLAMAASLLLGYWTVAGVRDVERRQNRSLEGEKLGSMWLYTAVIQGITYVCGWIPLVGEMGDIAALVMGICFLVAFYRTKNLYEING